MIKKEKIKPADVLNRIQDICSKQEKSPSEAISLLKKWGIDQASIKEIIDKLKSESFLDENRYATFFVRDKIRFEHWGKVKIKFGLLQKGITETYIEQAISGIDKAEYCEMIKKELQKKKNTIGSGKDAWQKLARFGSSRGYEMEIMYDLLEEICGKGKE